MLARARRLALDALFPPQCALCGQHGTLLCNGCMSDLPRAAGSRCGRCWVPVARKGLCRHCTESEPVFASIRAACVMDAGARRLAHMLKYDGLTSLAEPMAQLMVATTERQDVDVVVPVPLHGRRERSRGYNQSAELARHIAAMRGVTFDPRVARRDRDTAPLVKTMSREERRQIMAEAFAARRDGVDGMRVLLIDDVVTTGATLGSCAAALLDAGARSVHCLTWARAD